MMVYKVRFGQKGLLGHLWLTLRLCLLALLVTGLSACGDLSREEQASLAAKGYYTHLVKGEYRQFLEGKAGADKMPEGYSNQLLTAYRQFMAQQQRDHQGISSVGVSNAVADSLTQGVTVFLILNYGDNTTEEIAVGMTEQDGKWRMK